MRVIKLTHGPGNGVDKACLMTASNMLIGRGENGDYNSCVCPLLRCFIIPTNDAMPLHALREWYGPLCWEILGTETLDQEIQDRRAFAFVDWAVREIAPVALDRLGCYLEVNELKNLSPIVDTASADKAVRVTCKILAAIAKLRSKNLLVSKTALIASASSSLEAANSAARCIVNGKRYDAIKYAANCVTFASYAGALWHRCPEIIRRVAAIGDKRPVECVINREQLENALA